MALNDLAHSRLAALIRKPGSRTLPLPGWRMMRVKCLGCGLSVTKSRWTKHCRRCRAEMPPKPPYLCRLCGEPCPGRRSSWCSDECMDAYYTATDAGWLRRKVLKRDKGICAACGIDAEALGNRLDYMHHEQRTEAFKVLRENGFNVPSYGTYSCSSLWEADHVEALDEGGSRELSNVQTLCHPCHKEKTAEQASRRGKQQRLIGRKWRRTQEMLRLSQGGTYEKSG